MNKIENIVKEHYSTAELGERILSGLTATGVDIDHLSIDDLAVVDELHIGGRIATEHALDKLTVSESDHVLDVGCGIGGPARTLVSRSRCTLTGIDLTPGYINVARTLTRLTGLEDRARFEVASALSMPFADETFDAAITFHVAMNIHDRAALYGEIARVLKGGASLCIYDVMKKNDEAITFPLPWAETEVSSHLETSQNMETYLDNAGFDVREIEDRSTFADDYFKQRLAAVGDTPSPLGPHLVMGATAREKFENTYNNLKHGCIAPVVIIAQKRTA